MDPSFKQKAVVVPPGFEPRSEEPESSMMDRYTKGLWSCESRRLLQFNGLRRDLHGGESKQDFGNPGQHHDDHKRCKCILGPRACWFGFRPQVNTHLFGLGNQIGQFSKMFLNRIMCHDTEPDSRLFQPLGANSNLHRTTKEVTRL